MRPTTIPIVEPLEGKALLAGTVASALAVSLTAVPQATSTGTEIVFTFTETNVSGQAVNVAIGPSNDGFLVSQNGQRVWQSNAGPQPDVLMLQTLQPDQSLILQATWNGQPNLINPLQGGSPLTGTFTVENELDPADQTTATIPSTATNPTPIPMPIPITHPTTNPTPIIAGPKPTIHTFV